MIGISTISRVVNRNEILARNQWISANLSRFITISPFTLNFRHLKWRHEVFVELNSMKRGRDVSSYSNNLKCAIHSIRAFRSRPHYDTFTLYTSTLTNSFVFTISYNGTIALRSNVYNFTKYINIELFIFYLFFFNKNEYSV